MRRLGAAALPLAALCLAGCGDAEGTLSAQDRDALHAEIDAVRAAVKQGRESTALAAVRELRGTVRDLAARGELNAADAKVLLTQVNRLTSTLEDQASARPAAAPTEAPTKDEQKEQDKNDEQDKDDDGKGKGKGKGREG